MFPVSYILSGNLLWNDSFVSAILTISYHFCNIFCLAAAIEKMCNNAFYIFTSYKSYILHLTLLLANCRPRSSDCSHFGWRRTRRRAVPGCGGRGTGQYFILILRYEITSNTPNWLVAWTYISFESFQSIRLTLFNKLLIKSVSNLTRKCCLWFMTTARELYTRHLTGLWVPSAW